MTSTTNLNITRRTFARTAAVATAGIALSMSGNGVDIAFADGVVDKNAPIEKRYTYCDMCNQVPKCGLTAYVQDGHVVRVESRSPHPATPLCSKGLAVIQELYDPDRLLYPMRRTNKKGSGDPQWERISWDEALTTIAGEFNRVKEQYGPDAVLFYCGDPKEPRSALMRLSRLFGSSSLGDESSLCATATFMCSRMVYGMNAISMGVDPTPDTGTCIIWSRNCAWATPNLHGPLMTLKEKGVKYVIVDPRITPTVMGLADIHLQPRPGTDGALVLGFINILIRDNLYDKDFVDNWTIGFDALAKSASEYTPERVEEITWVPAEKLEAAVKLAAENTPVTIITSASGIAHSTNVGHSLRAVFMIPALLGSVDVKGGHTFGGPPPDFSGNTGAYFSTTAFRLDSVYENTGMKERRFDKNDFPAWAFLNPHMQMAKIPEYINEGKLRAALFIATNVMIWPESNVYQEAIGKLEFSVAADYYMRPWTHDYVDIILPAATCFERSAPFGVYGTKVYYREPVVKPFGEAKEDWQIILEIGCKLGFEEECFGGSVEKAIEYIFATSKTGVTLQDVRDHIEDGYVVPGRDYVEKKYEKGMLRPDGKPGFTTLSGKVEFDSEVLKKCGLPSVPVYEEPIHSPLTAEGQDKNYPLILNTGGRIPYYTHSKLRNIPWLNQFMPNPVVRLHPKDAAARGISTGDQVRIFNHLAEIFMTAEVTNLVLPGVVDIFHGWHQANVNLLIPRDFDAITGFPPFRAQLCDVRLV